MDILPRVNFVSSMLPLPPPNGYWDKLNKVISKFVWDGKRPRLKWSTLQRRKSDGGLAVPFFKLYFWSYVLRPVSIWFDPNVQVSWRPIEEALAHPHRLQDLVYPALPPKLAKHQWSFDDLCSLYNIPRNSFFFYFWLRLTTRTYGVPWGVALKIHSLHTLLQGVELEV